MLAELVDHVIGVDPDRDWMTGQVAITLTNGRVLTAEADAGQPAADLGAQETRLAALTGLSFEDWWR